MDRRKLLALPENLRRGLPYCTSPSRHPTQIRRPFPSYDSTCGAFLIYAEDSFLPRAKGGIPTPTTVNLSAVTASVGLPMFSERDPIEVVGASGFELAAS